MEQSWHPFFYTVVHLAAFPKFYSNSSVTRSIVVRVIFTAVVALLLQLIASAFRQCLTTVCFATPICVLHETAVHFTLHTAEVCQLFWYFCISHYKDYDNKPMLLRKKP